MFGAVRCLAMVVSASGWFQPVGQGWEQIANLALAFVLCALIGLEREVRQRAAGLRTHALVGLGAALFMLVSKYGFFDVLGDHVTLDPSRVAAQVVSGIGFIGGGLIFVRRDAVRGLTTAAVVWVACAVGMAAGAGLPLLAVAVTGGHFVVAFGLTSLTRRLPNSKHALRNLRVVYVGGTGALRRVLTTCTDRGFTVVEIGSDEDDDEQIRPEQGRKVSVQLRLRGVGPLTELAADLDDIEDVVSVYTGTRPADDHD